MAEEGLFGGGNAVGKASACRNGERRKEELRMCVQARQKMVVLVAGEDSHTLEEREEKEGYGSCSSRGRGAWGMRGFTWGDEKRREEEFIARTAY